jgi:prepilin-type N-terminal cleavage/methylation domain-containing protein
MARCSRSWLPRPGAIPGTRGLSSDSRRPSHRRDYQAFTLIELIIVMVVLAVLLALVAPSLTSSFRGRNLEQAGAQVLAVTEYGRDEAISQGVPVDVWINPANGQFGIAVKAGFPGDPARLKHYALQPELRFDAAASPGGAGTATASNGGIATPPVATGQGVTVAEFQADGTLDSSSNPTIRILGNAHSAVALTETSDGYGYELQKETH